MMNALIEQLISATGVSQGQAEGGGRINAADGPGQTVRR